MWNGNERHDETYLLVTRAVLSLVSLGSASDEKTSRTHTTVLIKAFLTWSSDKGETKRHWRQSAWIRWSVRLTGEFSSLILSDNP